MKDKTEKTAKFHEIASTKYNQIADELLKFMECSKTEIKLVILYMWTFGFKITNLIYGNNQPQIAVSDWLF